MITGIAGTVENRWVSNNDAAFVCCITSDAMRLRDSIDQARGGNAHRNDNSHARKPDTVTLKDYG